MITRRALLQIPAMLVVPSLSLAQGVQVVGAGASFPAPLYQRWATDASAVIGTRINYQSIGSGAGINQIRARTVTFGATDAPLEDPGDLYQFPTVQGEVVAAVNVPGVRTLNLTMEVVNKIYKGEIRRWAEPAIASLNPGVRLPNVPITPVYRADGSGTTFIWTRAMSAAGGWSDSGTSINWPTGQGARGNEGVASIVSRTIGAIGYIELVFAKVNNIVYAKLDVEVKGRTFILMSREPRDRAAHAKAVEFFEYCFTRGQDVARRMFYEPLTDDEYAGIIAELRKI